MNTITPMKSTVISWMANSTITLTCMTKLCMLSLSECAYLFPSFFLLSLFYMTNCFFKKQTGSIISLKSSKKELRLHFHLIDIISRPSVDFIGPLMVVERHRRDTRSRTKYKHHHRRCHFQGQVRDDHTSSVALSACDGIVSILFTQKIHLICLDSY